MGVAEEKTRKFRDTVKILLTIKGNKEPSSVLKERNKGLSV